MTFPLKLRDLDSKAQMALTIMEFKEGMQQPIPLAGTTFKLFSKHGRLKTGKQSLRLWAGTMADANCPTSTPGKVPVAQRGEIGRLRQLLKRYDRGEIEHVPWLDALTLSAVHALEKKHQPEEDAMKLMIELPEYPLAIIYQEGSAGAILNTTGLAVATPLAGTLSSSTTFTKFFDPEIGRQNPSEHKAQKLARGAGKNIIDKDLRPDTEEKRRIDTILSAPPNELFSSADKALLWRFRFALISEPKAMTRFLRCVDWHDAIDATTAIDLMEQWAPISIADALELLSPDFSNQYVRAYAVSVLKDTDDSELLSYLLQLVQALRYEPTDDSQLSRFLISRALHAPAVASSLFWYLCSELEDPTFGPRASIVNSDLLNAVNGSAASDSISAQVSLMGMLRRLADAVKNARLRSADRLREEVVKPMLAPGGACHDLLDFKCPCPLDPAIEFEGLSVQGTDVLKSNMRPLVLAFKLSKSEEEEIVTSPERMPSLAMSGMLLSATPADIVGMPSSLAGVVEQTSSRQGVEDVHGGDDDHDDKISKKEADSTSPLVSLLYKKGDDLRQDQLILQMISLIDRLFRREHVDLGLTPYKVLPTSSNDGLIEYVPSIPLSSIIKTSGSIIRHLVAVHPDPSAPLGVNPHVLDTFVRSAAGNCVVTYVLGVGDRHLDNILLAPDGRLFHIDFGYILGREPPGKGFAQPVRLDPTMVEAMGGQESSQYKRFLSLCCEAYNILRKSSTLLLSLLHLMAGSSIPDIRSDPEKALLKLQERLRLDLGDEEAAAWMVRVLNDSVRAMMPQIMETAHRLAKQWL